MTNHDFQNSTLHRKSPNTMDQSNTSRNRSNRRPLLFLVPVIAAASLFGGRILAQKIGYTDTAFLPGNKWRVHDGTRPQPKIIDAGTASTEAMPGRPPSEKRR